MASLDVGEPRRLHVRVLLTRDDRAQRHEVVVSAEPGRIVAIGLTPLGTEAYRIEGGKVGAPVKGATLIGNGPDVLTKVSMVGNDMALDPGVGTCGKDGQGVPVGVGQPTLKIDELTVGGTEV